MKYIPSLVATTNFLVLICATSRASAQPVFSIDFQGPTIGMVDSFSGAAMTEGDLLVASPSGVPVVGPAAPPRIAVFAGAPNPGGAHLGLSAYASTVGHVPGVVGLVEVDALSFGTDFLLDADPPFLGVWTFSVDEFATGLPPGAAMPLNVRTEGAVGALEACADIFGGYGPGDYGPGPLPYSPITVPPPGNAVLIDGNGASPPAIAHPSLPAVYGLGLTEPNPPTSPPGPPVSLPDLGDNVDALDVDTGGPPGSIPFPIYFSLDAAFADPLETPTPPDVGPVNSGSAVAHGFSGADVLVTLTPGSAPVVYAAANILGLDLLNGPDSDDLDALVLWENGVPGYQPSVAPLPPYDWGPGGADMLLFSVRRGSTVIGYPDSIFGIAIEEGDILVPPMVGGTPFPGLFIAGGNLGLKTIRADNEYPPDDLDALDVSPDCNGNVVPDGLEIAWGLAADCNANRIPDSCETLCGDTVCCPAENSCNCPADCGPPVAESPGVTCADALDNDCDGPIDCADAGCAGDVTCLCGNTVCDPGESSCMCPADCGAPPAMEVTGSTCADGLDNDCDLGADCLDADCAAEPSCGCNADTDCDDGLSCTCDECSTGGCVFTALDFGDADCTGVVDVDDIVCVLDGFTGFFGTCSLERVDLAPCEATTCASNQDCNALGVPCVGGRCHVIDVDDILAVLDAFAGLDPCGC